MGKIRGTHSSPGIFDKITDLSYAANTMGITTAALVGETIKGPAFQPIKVAKWGDYVGYFGGTSAKKFRGSQYPKYELPYIAKSYLKASDQLYVCRVLGLSGYNAGPAFLIEAVKNSGEENAEKMVIAVLRARGKYVNKPIENSCGAPNNEDVLDFDCDEIDIDTYKSLNIHSNCDDDDRAVEDGSKNLELTALNMGRFTIIAKKYDKTDGTYNTVGTYPVSLNAGEKDYIYNVLGASATEGTAPVFVEEFYDVMLSDAIARGYNRILTASNGVDVLKEVQYKLLYKDGKEVVADSLLLKKPADLTKKDLKKYYFYNQAVYFAETGESAISSLTNNSLVEVVETYDESGNTVYTYTGVTDENDSAITITSAVTTGKTYNIYNVLYVADEGCYIHLTSGNTAECIFDDASNYCEMYRYASTPWIVSELKGDANNIEIKKLFRFHTITDGNYANQHIKISITNIMPDEGTFDVVIRDFDDSDANPVVLENYRALTMVPGDSRYIGLKIGTVDGAYETKSKYVTVEVIENDMTAQCIPAGFLGYPVRSYKEVGAKSPYMKFNTKYDNDIKDRRQYFGVSDIVGIDVDMFNYKGKDAYTSQEDGAYTAAFHMDSMLSQYILDTTTTITLDGKVVTFDWQTVDSHNFVDSGRKSPIIASEYEMKGTIYENVKTRKFTVCPFGGFDGWDIYRDARTNTNKYKASQYKGVVNQANGKSMFQRVPERSGLALTGNCITSDYYAYLAGINEFINPTQIEINLFATPGIDYVNNSLLVEDAIEVIEGRFDTLYIPTTPDKPWGASDDAAEMFTALEAAENLEDTNISTYYAATYYPWVKYLDTENNIYINLPATKDVLRNMAEVDDKRFPWIAPAGMERGKVECKKLHTPSTIEERDNAYDGRINPLIDYSKDGVRVWGNKTMYICEETNPMNRVNAVRCVLYMRKLVNESSRSLIFDPNDETLADEYRKIVEPIMKQIKKDRGITDYKLNISQTAEQMDLHELSCTLFVKPTPTLEYIEINYVVTPQGIRFEDIKF